MSPLFSLLLGLLILMVVFKTIGTPCMLTTLLTQEQHLQVQVLKVASLLAQVPKVVAFLAQVLKVAALQKVVHQVL